MTCYYCDKDAIKRCWSLLMCDVHSLNIITENIYRCTCGKIIEDHFQCNSCDVIKCSKCRDYCTSESGDHCMRKIVGGYSCEDCGIYTSGHVCEYMFVPSDNTFDKSYLIVNEDGSMTDEFNDIELSDGYPKLIMQAL